MANTTLTVDVEYDDEWTDPEGLWHRLPAWRLVGHAAELTHAQHSLHP